jgi:predicted DNA-binding transcriptional regulator
MDDNKIEEQLKGTTREVYHCLLKNGKPIGVREVQRKLALSTPSLATYHLAKLEEIGLVKKENGGFIVTKVLTGGNVKVKHFLVPRFLFYSVFSALAVMFELFLKPPLVTTQYVFSLASTLFCALIFCFETARTWKKGSMF